MKHLFTLTLGLLSLLMISMQARAQCDATFSYIATASTTYHLSSNQQLQTGYTYYHTWKVGNNVIANTTTADYTFPAQGNYKVCHIINIQDAGANTVCVDSSCIYLQITQQPPCFPQVTVHAIQTSPHDFQFSNTLANYTNVDIRWTFGDGTSINGVASPAHHYNNFGWYTACLYITDTVLFCSDTICVGVHPDTTIVNPCQLNTQFKANQPTYSSAVINFTEQSSGTYQTTLWSYGDGTTSTTFQSSHQYSSFGVYNVCLTHTDTITGCTENYCRSIAVDSCQAGFANFYTNQLSYATAISFHPNKLSNVNTLTWHWDFGDSTYDFTHKGTTHTYATMDTFTACLYVTAMGCPEVVVCKQVIPQCNVHAGFSMVIIGPNTSQFHSTSSGSNLTYTWLFGDTTIGDEQAPIHAYPQSGIYTPCVVATDSVYGCTDTACATYPITAFTDTVCGHVFIDYNLNGLQDTLEPPVTGASILCSPSGTIFTTDSAGHYEGLVPWDVFSTILTIKLLYGGTHVNTLPFGTDEYNYIFTMPNQKQCGLDFGIVTATAQITGKVFNDINMNSMIDNGEYGIPNQLIHAGNQIAVTGTDGNYVLVSQLGPYTVWKDSIGHYDPFPSAPPLYQVNAFTPGGFYSNVNFGIGVPANYQDVAIDLIPTTPVTATSKSHYHLVTTNVGNKPALFVHGIICDPALTFDSSTSTNFMNYPVTRTTEWGSSVAPMQQYIHSGGYKVPSSVVLNQDIYNEGYTGIAFGTDMNPVNNRDTVHQIVVAPYDPNNKIPDEVGTGPNGYINGNEKIKFVINFENLGNYYAMNVVVKDMIGPEFDLSSFRFVGSSHKEVRDVRLDGNTVYFRFSGIKLPYSKPESQGWVAFEIKPKQNLTPGTQLHNTAAIYFDYNEPVITNTTLHTIAEPASVIDFTDNRTITIAPNPFNEKTRFTVDGIAYGYNFELYNISGKLEQRITSIQNSTFELERNGLSAGMYFYKIIPKNGVEMQGKIVVQ